MSALTTASLLPAHVTSVAEKIASAHSENTTSTYSVGWASWERFCKRYRYMSFPASPETVAAWLVQLQSEGKSVSTVLTYYQGVADAHRAAGMADVLAVEGVRRVLMGVRRAARGQEKHKARALSVEELRAMVSTEDRTLLATRNRAWLLLSSSIGLRYSDSAVLRKKHVRFVEGKGCVVTVPWSKTDQEGKGVDVAVSTLLPQFRALDATHALANLLRMLPDEPEQHLFPGVFKGGYKIRESAMTNQGLNTALIKMALNAGVNSEGLSSHSARATFATNAYASGASEHSISLTGRWSSLVVQRGYRRISDDDLFSDVASDWAQRLLMR